MKTHFYWKISPVLRIQRKNPCRITSNKWKGLENNLLDMYCFLFCTMLSEIYLQRNIHGKIFKE